ncbi:autotransporter-associated beta strand repeat-containing protein [Sphingobium sp. CFD-2]|uniref:autotransporter-associated beta strand repeat-containing protein n=1 Tax=Sphingobium sp. CFD-2 TaxID=2878542 RepID=UPI00214D1280|nr:autotransporter-associated beta strand repeat-containing protein [Sphingobium sp. CFD-2]
MLAYAKRNLFRSAAITRLLALGTSMLVVSPAAAQDIATGDGRSGPVSWLDPASWADISVPTAADDVVVNAPLGVQVAGGAASSRSVDVGSGGDGLLIVGTGGTLASNALSQNMQSRLGVLDGDRGEAAVTGAWTLDHALIVGAGGAGRLGISEGGQVSSIAGIVGSDVPAAGTAIITGPGSHWQIRDRLTLGVEGRGTLVLQDGGTLTSNEGVLGGTVDGVGIVNLSGLGSSWDMVGDLYVGHHGSGTLTVADQGAVSSLRGVIAYFEGSTGAATVTGTGSHWAMGDNLQVGRAGTGELHITAGATVRSRYGAIGAETSKAFGIVEVTGPGSTLTVDDLLYVGRFGRGDLRIGDGGAVHSASGVIALGSSAIGTTIVDGRGAQWDVTNELVVANQGAGTLILGNGGSVRAGSLVLGVNGSGTLTIGAALGETAVAPGWVDAPTVALGSGNGTVNFNHSQDGYLFSPAIGGMGTVNVLSGRTVLAGANSYGGTTTIAEGATLQVGNGGTVGSLASDVVLGGGTLAFARSDPFAFDSVISGTGHVTQSGGTLILSGASSFTGDVTVTGGTLRLAVPGALGDEGNMLVLGAATLEAGASIMLAQNLQVASPHSNTIDTSGFDLRLSGVIADGPGTTSGNYLNKLGSGTLTLTAANSYTNRIVLCQRRSKSRPLGGAKSGRVIRVLASAARA